MKSNNQGKDTDTVLTNLSKYVKVVSNEPYCQRKHHRYGLPSLRKLSEEQLGRRRNVRGLRPLHQTTLVFETLPVDSKVLSTMKESFSGRCDLPHTRQPTTYPSLHTSQFKIGINSELDLKTTSRDSFTDNSKHPATVHVSRARWKRQMAGRDMMNCTRHEGFKDNDFVTTYSRNYQRFLSLEYDKSNCRLNGQWKTSIYNIVNGQPKMESTKKFNLVSGNQILQNARKQPLTLS